MSPKKPIKYKVGKESQRKISSFFTKLKDASEWENFDSNIVNGTNANVPADKQSKKRKEPDSCSPDKLAVHAKKLSHISKKAVKVPDNISKHTVEPSVGSKKEVIQVHVTKPKVLVEKKVSSNNYNTSHSMIGKTHNSLKETVSHKDTVDNFKCIEQKAVNDDDNLSEFFKENHFDSFFEQDIDALFEDDVFTDKQIDFSSLKRCQIIDVKNEEKALVLTVQEHVSKITGTVKCFGFWKEVNVEKDDIVTIQAVKNSEEWIVDNNNGFLVINPDLLIPITTIVGGLFCNRRAALNEKFRKIEFLPSTEPAQSVMAMGSLIHQLLQKVCQDVPFQDLKTHCFKEADVQKSLDSILASKDTVNLLYSCDVSLAKCRKEITDYVPDIFAFINHYMQGGRQESIAAKRDNYEGRITDICDIEENVWVPMLGMKGKIDMTVQVNIHQRKRTLPLEMKSGRTTYSLEHKGQVILYAMMMALLDEGVDSGLLLYLKGNSMKEIKGGHYERRDLVLLRNTLVNYFARESASEELSPLKLPPPINHRNACAKCSFNSLCCAYISKDSEISLPDSHPVTELSRELLHNITNAHIDYVVKWVSLMQMEENSQTDNRAFSKLWTSTPENREKKGSCIANLKIAKVTKHSDRYAHEFVRTNGIKECTKISFLEFAENEYVLVSKENRLNVSSGYITELQENSVTVLLDRDITRRYPDAIFCIDKYTFAGSLLSCYANVGGLLNDDATSEKLRQIVIDRKPATFKAGTSLSALRSTEQKLLRHLNKNQRRAVLKVLSANDYVVIKGMPGTGKTQTLVALIRLLHQLGKSVLVTAHTHSAVDNILTKLVEQDVDVLRLGLTTSIDPRLKSKSEEHATANCRTPEALSALYRSKKIVGVTCLGAYHALLAKEKFDVCIVDESAQIAQPEVLRPLYSSRIFVLAGDPDQLPPLIKNKTARRLGADESLFVRLDSENNTVVLDLQYRMNERIMSLANDLTYNGQLKAANDSVESATIVSPTCPAEHSMSDERWMKTALSTRIEDAVVVLDTGLTNDLKLPQDFCDKGLADSDQVYSNVWEAAIVVCLARELSKIGVSKENIGVIAPYRAHVLLLQKFLDDGVEVNTVDQYQGRDKEVIIYSCARSVSVQSEKMRELEILEDHRRLTVAVTRAKRKLIIVADKNTVSRYTPFKKLFEHVPTENTVCMRNEDSEQSYETFVKVLSCLR